MHPAIFTLALALSIVPAPAGAADTSARLHLDRILASAPDTPQQQGLLAVAEAEAAALKHAADLATQLPDDREWINVHLLRVLASLDPEGGTAGFGLVRAVDRIAIEIAAAAEAGDGPAGIAYLAGPSAAVAANMRNWSTSISALAERARSAGSAGEAATLALSVLTLAGFMADGVDANSDGKVSLEPGEGGLLQLRELLGAGIPADLPL